MKYLPGDRKVQAAKADIAKDWKIDFTKTFGTTHKKLEKLAADKVKEVDKIAIPKVYKSEKEINKNKKKVININLKASPESAYGNLKNLMQQLDKMVNYVQSNESPTLHSIPIYSKEARGQVLPAYSNQWLQLQLSMLHENQKQPRQSFMDVLEDFKVKSYVAPDCKLVMKNKPQHVLKEFTKNGQEHYLLVKNKLSKPQEAMEVEDIFRDWRSNLVDIFEQRRLAALAARKNRKRKLSNRALRKELLREIDEAEKKKPMSYSDILKKNLKVPMEDIFEAWRDYLQELDEILSNDSRTSFCKDESPEDILDSAQSYQKSILDCGQPTIVVPAKKKKTSFEKEVIFASWRHNLTASEQPQIEVEIGKYQPENIFAAWKFNLKEETEAAKAMMELDEANIFQDWAHNLAEIEDKLDTKMLKNKPRQQRKSKKGKHH